MNEKCRLSIAIITAILVISVGVVSVVHGQHPQAIAPLCKQSGLRSRDFSVADFSAGGVRNLLDSYWPYTPAFFLDCFSFMFTPHNTDPACVKAVNETDITIDFHHGMIDYGQVGPDTGFSVPIRNYFGGSLMSMALWPNYYSILEMNVRSNLPSGCSFNLLYSLTAFKPAVWATQYMPNLNRNETVPFLRDAAPQVILKKKKLTLHFSRYNRAIGTPDRVALATKYTHCVDLPTDVETHYPVPDYDPRPSSGDVRHFTWTLPQGITNHGYYFICVKMAYHNTWFEAGYIDVHGHNPAYFIIHKNSTVANGNELDASGDHMIMFYGIGLDLRPGHDTAKAVKSTDTCESGAPAGGAPAASDLGPTDDYGDNVTVAHWRVKLTAGSYRICYKTHDGEWVQVHYYDQLPPKTQDAVGNLSHLLEPLNLTDVDNDNTTQIITSAPPGTMAPGMTPEPTAVVGDDTPAPTPPPLFYKYYLLNATTMFPSPASRRQEGAIGYTYDEATAACAAMGGWLAVFHNSSVWDHFREQGFSPETTELPTGFWIGGRDSGDNYFRWSAPSNPLLHEDGGLGLPFWNRTQKECLEFCNWCNWCGNNITQVPWELPNTGCTVVNNDTYDWFNHDCGDESSRISALCQFDMHVTPIIPTAEPTTMAPPTPIPTTEEPSTQVPPTPIPTTAEPTTQAPPNITDVPTTPSPPNETDAPPNATDVPSSGSGSGASSETSEPETPAPSNESTSAPMMTMAPPNETAVPATPSPPNTTEAPPHTDAPTAVPPVPVNTSEPGTSAPVVTLPTSAPSTNSPLTAVPSTAQPQTPSPPVPTNVPSTASPPTPSPPVSTDAPTASPTDIPSSAPTAAPTKGPTNSPSTLVPPTPQPTAVPPVTTDAPQTASPTTRTPSTPSPTSVPPVPPVPSTTPSPPCVSGTLPPSWVNDPSVILNDYVTLTMDNGNLDKKSFTTTIATALCVPSTAIRIVDSQPQLVDGQWELRVGVVCEQHDGCDNDERMQYLLYLMSGSSAGDEELKGDLGVSGAERASSEDHNVNTTSSEEKGILSTAAGLAIIVVLTVALILVMVVVAIRCARRRRRQDHYRRNHMEFSPDARDGMVDSDRPEFDDIAAMQDMGHLGGVNDPTPAVVMDMDEIEVVEKKHVEEFSDDDVEVMDEHRDYPKK